MKVRRKKPRTFEVTVYTNEPDVVSVKNIGEHDYHYPLGGTPIAIPMKGTLLMKTGLAKTLLGDWTKKGEYAEEKRKANKGISDVSVWLREETRELEVKKKVETIVEVQTVEEEFVDLKDETMQCSALTKAGKRCKRDSLKGEKWCMSHVKTHKEVD